VVAVVDFYAEMTYKLVAVGQLTDWIGSET
jgi:hypothetical protein